jgi:hypothetical protein
VKRSKKILFYSILFLLPLGLWWGLENLANWATHRFDPLKRDRNKGTYYLNQSYFNDFFLFEKKDLFPTSLAIVPFMRRRGDVSAFLSSANPPRPAIPTIRFPNSSARPLSPIICVRFCSITGRCLKSNCSTPAATP